MHIRIPFWLFKLFVPKAVLEDTVRRSEITGKAGRSIRKGRLSASLEVERKP